MKKLKYGAIVGLALTIYTLAVPIYAAADEASFAEVTYGQETISEADEATEAISDNVRVGSRLWELFFGKDDDEREVVLCPGGDVFGVKIKQNNVTVADAKGIPALKSGDVIISINGQKVNSAQDIKDILKRSEGESVTIKAIHGGTEIGLEVRPTLIDGEYKLGVTLREGAAGIGTVTFIDPETGLFGGLGHGICDGDTGEVVSMESGEICEVVLGGIHKGECGKPGELCGILTDEALGTLTNNCECGVFGIINAENLNTGDTLPIGRRDEVTEGEATILSTLKNGKTAEYKIEIFDIDRNSDGSKSFKIKVTDPTLIALTGGIVRGMSGSPIIQNGKLIGAVTHVMVANPTEGYGIFIENMLSAANQQTQKKAA